MSNQAIAPSPRGAVGAGAQRGAQRGENGGRPLEGDAAQQGPRRVEARGEQAQLRLATFNCNEKLRTDPEDVAAVVARLGADIVALQDTGINTVGGEVHAGGKMWEKGYILVAKSLVPRSKHGEYTAQEMRLLHRQVAERRPTPPTERARLAWAIRSTIMGRCQVAPSGLANSRLQALRVHLPIGTLLLVNVYLPPNPTPADVVPLTHTVDALDPRREAHLIIMGDMNAVQDPALDRQRDGAATTAGERYLADQLIGMGVVESFRELHPDARVYSFSRMGRHKSRIDQIWVDREVIQLVIDARVWAIRHNDHEPVSTTLAIPVGQYDRPPNNGIQAIRYNFPEATRAIAIPQKWGDFQGRVTQKMQGVRVLSAVLANVGRLEAAVDAFQNAVAEALEETFGTRKRRKDRRPGQSKIAMRLRSRIRKITALEVEIRCTAREGRLASQVQLQRAAALCGALVPSAAEATRALRRKRKDLGNEIARIVEAEKKMAAEQEAKVRVAEMDADRGFKRYSAKIETQAKGAALQRENGSIATAPVEVRDITREFYYRLVGVAQPCPEADQGPWQQFDQAQSAIPIRQDVSHQDIDNYIQGAKLNKATDYLGINGVVLWFLPADARAILARIFEGILHLEYVPDRWTMTRMILLYKKGAATSLQNYRPVSIVNYWVKVLDGILFRRVVGPLEASARLHRMQWAGRPGTGCTEALGLLDQALDHAKRNARKGRHIYAALFDAYKAYDTVPQQVMFNRISRIGFPWWAQALRTIYARLKVTVATCAGYTDPIPIRQGIAQGMQSSPLAFVIFMNALISLLAARANGYIIKVFGDHRGTAEIHWPQARLSAVAIVDDVLAVSNSAQELQNTVDVYSDFGSKNNQRMSLDKSQFVSSERGAGSIHTWKDRLCPPERGDGQGRVNKRILGPTERFRYLGIERTVEDRGKGTPQEVEDKLYTVLSHLTRKPAPGPIITKVYHAMVESTIRYAAPWTVFTRTQLQRWQGATGRILRKAQGLTASTRSKLLLHPRVCGIRPLEVAIEAARADAFVKLTSMHLEVIAVFHCNDLDATLNDGHGAGSLFQIEQRYDYLKRSMWGDMWGICKKYGFRAMWSGGPLHVGAGDAALVKWTSSQNRPGDPNGRSDRVTVECHKVGVIAVPKGLASRLQVMCVRQMMVQGQGGFWAPVQPRFPTSSVAWANGLIDGALPPGALAQEAWLRWRATFLDQGGAPSPAWLVPPVGRLEEITRHRSLPLCQGLLTFAIVPTAQFINPPRGPYSGGGVLLCMDRGLVWPFRTTSAQSVHHTCAMGALVALTIIQPQQRAIISTPMEYVERLITNWDSLPEGRKVVCKARSTIEAAHEMWRMRPQARIVTTPTNDLGSQLDPRISNVLVNQNPDRWWNGEDGGQVRAAARAAAQARPTFPRIPPPPGAPLRLVFMDSTLQENREGRLSHFIHKCYDTKLEEDLSQHPLLGAYFGRGVHPCTWSALIHHPERSWFIKARGQTLAIGVNIVNWGLQAPDEPEARCMCNWYQARIELESLQHVLLECPLFNDVAAPLRQGATLEEALGLVRDIQITPANAGALAEAMERQQVLIKTALATWKRRVELRKVALAVRRAP